MDVDAYFEQPVANIVADICDLKVPKEILLDQDGWDMLCTVRSRSMATISGDNWSELCLIRSRLAEG
jgi:hypothetical protein